MRSTICALVAALLVTASPALAGGGAGGDWELGIYGGYGILDDYGMVHPKDNLLYGARLGYFFTPQWSGEISGQRLGTDSEFDLIGVEDVDVNLHAFRFNALYNFRPGQRLRPFLTAGVGYETIDVDGFGESCDWGWNAGGGVRWFMTPQWNLRADARYIGVNVGGDVDESQGNVEATLGIGFMFGGRGEHTTSAAPPPANGPPTVSVASDRPEILPGESVTLRATASDPDGDPLTYEWSTTAGRVTGTGSTAAFDFTGATPPSTATITVRVSDGQGHAATSNVAVSLRQPVPPATAVSCLAGGFPPNLSRLTNVDKACLDDVSQRLRSDPRARVIVIGHADGRETSADQIAGQRAAAVKTYLVQDRGIEASRVTSRSAAATKPLDTGTNTAAQARNRRVEVWFVPEGATAPD